VAIAKVCGIETEYGVRQAGVLPNPTVASTALINGYLAAVASGARWDFADEHPGQDARGFARETSQHPEVETHLVNVVLTNGARYYVDHAHPEYSTPECATALELVKHDRACELVLERSMRAAAEFISDGAGIVVYKNNSDGKGNSYGCHENYLLDRALPFARLAAELTPHLVTRQIYTGAGKLGYESQRPDDATSHYQLSQRSEFFEEPIGLETTLKRPIINTRDEPHADPAKYRRLHVIVGDANLCEVATYLKVGVTALVLAMIEDDAFAGRELVLAEPVAAIRRVAADPSLTTTVALADGTRRTAIELQWELFERSCKYAEDRGLDAIGGEEAGRAVLERWESVLHDLELDPRRLRRQLDWVAKLELIDAYQERHSCEPGDHRLRLVDLQYHDLRPERSLFRRLDTERLVDLNEVAEAVTEPPNSTRAYFRGRCLQQFSGEVVTANWDSVVFDTQQGALQRVPTLEPLKGTAAHVANLFEGCGSAAELLRRLGA
jgi:proteasome accessory factor PafA2